METPEASLEDEGRVALEQGAAAWNRWRALADVQRPVLVGFRAVSHNFVGADLRLVSAEGGEFTDGDMTDSHLDGGVFRSVSFDRCNLTGATVGQARFVRCSFRDATLASLSGVTPGQFSGCDLAGATIPGFPKADGVAATNATVDAARAILYVLAFVCTFVGLTVISTDDLMLMEDRHSLLLPLVGVAVKSSVFYPTATALILLLFAYFQLHLLSFWRWVGRLPAVFPDATRLDHVIHPWIFTSLATRGLYPLEGGGNFEARLSNSAAIVVGWILGPATLSVVALRYLARQDYAGSLWMTAAGLAAVWLGLKCWGACEVAEQGRLAAEWRASWRRMLVCSAVALFGLTLAAARFPGVLGRLVYLDVSGRVVSVIPGNATASCDIRMIEGGRFRGRSLRSLVARRAFFVNSDFVQADLRRAILVGADLRGAMFSGADLTGADLSGADLRGADLRGAHLALADFRNSKLDGANVSGTDLRRMLWGAEMERVKLISDSRTQWPSGGSAAK